MTTLNGFPYISSCNGRNVAGIIERRQSTCFCVRPSKSLFSSIENRNVGGQYGFAAILLIFVSSIEWSAFSFACKTPIPRRGASRNLREFSQRSVLRDSCALRTLRQGFEPDVRSLRGQGRSHRTRADSCVAPNTRCARRILHQARISRGRLRGRGRSRRRRGKSWRRAKNLTIEKRTRVPLAGAP